MSKTAQISFGSQLKYDPHASLVHKALKRILMVKKIKFECSSHSKCNFLNYKKNQKK